jgi:hypothetical protein
MADHDDSTASLGCTQASPVHHPVGPPIPEVFQTTGDRGHVPAGAVGPAGAAREARACATASAGRGEKPLGVLDDDPSGSGLVDEPKVLVEEPVELPEQSGSAAGEPGAVRRSDGRVLAGEPPADEIGSVE